VNLLDSGAWESCVIGMCVENVIQIGGIEDFGFKVGDDSEG
jgi:hypothetical protein